MNPKLPIEKAIEWIAKARKHSVGNAPYSELAMHTKIAGKRIRKYKVKNQNLSSVYVDKDPNPVTGLHSEVLPYDVHSKMRKAMDKCAELIDIRKSDWIHLLSQHQRARDKNAGKPIARNTRVIKRGDDYAVRLHNTDVFTAHKKGHYTLNSGGWRTRTTKERINEHLPEGVSISQHKRKWHVHDSEGKKYPFYDGMKIHRTGKPVRGQKPTQDQLDVEAEGREPSYRSQRKREDQLNQPKSSMIWAHHNLRKPEAE